MKTLTTTAIILTLSLSGSAFAGDNFWAKNGKLLDRNSNPMDDTYLTLTTSTIGSQPGVGSVSNEHNVAANNNFWALNGKLLDRFSNPNDYSSVSTAQNTAIGSQPGYGSSSNVYTVSDNINFWNKYGGLLDRKTNPMR